MIHVLWEESFKSLEADYSNHLASPLVASSGETSPSPRIRCDKIKPSCQRCQFLGTQKQATPRMWHKDPTSPQRTCLIGRCKDMMSKMDPMKARGWHDEVARTSLVTRKFSSSIFRWKELRKNQEGESKNTKDKSCLLHFDASGKGLSPTFYSHKGAYWRKTCDSTVHVSRTYSWQHSRMQSKLQ